MFRLTFPAVAALAALLCTSPLPAEELDLLTLRSGVVLLGVYDADKASISMRGGAIGDVFVDPHEIVNRKKKSIGGADAAKTAAQQIAKARLDLVTSQENQLKTQKTVDDLNKFIAILDENISKQNKKAADAARHQKQLEDKVTFTEAKNGGREELLRREAIDAKTEAEELAKAVAPLVQDKRQAEAKLVLAEKANDKLKDAIVEARARAGLTKDAAEGKAPSP
jgi:hypothetical protein